MSNPVAKFWTAIMACSRDMWSGPYRFQGALIHRPSNDNGNQAIAFTTDGRAAAFQLDASLEGDANTVIVPLALVDDENGYFDDTAYFPTCLECTFYAPFVVASNGRHADVLSDQTVPDPRPIVRNWLNVIDRKDEIVAIALNADLLANAQQAINEDGMCQVLIHLDGTKTKDGHATTKAPFLIVGHGSQKFVILMPCACDGNGPSRAHEMLSKAIASLDSATTFKKSEEPK